MCLEVVLVNYRGKIWIYNLVMRMIRGVLWFIGFKELKRNLIFFKLERFY